MEKQRIRLTVENGGGVERKAWPITQGVPFAEVRRRMERLADVLQLKAGDAALLLHRRPLSDHRWRYNHWCLQSVAAGQS